MIGKSSVLAERDPEKVDPLRWKILVKLAKEEWKSPIHRPDNIKQGDTTRLCIQAEIVKMGRLAPEFTDEAEFKVGLFVVLDPSLDVNNRQRAFTWKGHKFMLCDASDIIAVSEGVYA